MTIDHFPREPPELDEQTFLEVASGNPRRIETLHPRKHRLQLRHAEAELTRKLDQRLAEVAILVQRIHDEFRNGLDIVRELGANLLLQVVGQRLRRGHERKRLERGIVKFDGRPRLIRCVIRLFLNRLRAAARADIPNQIAAADGARTGFLQSERGILAALGLDELLELEGGHFEHGLPHDVLGDHAHTLSLRGLHSHSRILFPDSERCPKECGSLGVWE